MRLVDLNPCTGGLAFVRLHGALRAAWEAAETDEERRYMMWLVSRAHTRGTLTRRRLVQVALRCVEPVMHLLHDDQIGALGVVTAWTVGEATIDEVRGARDRLYAAAYAARAAAYAARAAAYAATYAYAAYAAYVAAAVARAEADAAAEAATTCDGIRDAITIDEVCAALGMDPDASTKGDGE